MRLKNMLLLESVNFKKKCMFYPSFKKRAALAVCASTILIFIVGYQSVNSVVLTTIYDLDLPPTTDLQPPSQDWAQQQFSKAVKMLNFTHSRPNRWNLCQEWTYYFPKLHAVFTGVAKAGYANWMSALLRANGRYYRLHRRTRTDMLSKPRFFSLRNISKVDFNDNVFHDAFSFTAVRNPWTRLVSGFRDHFSEDVSNMSSLAKEIVREMRGVNDSKKAETRQPNFEEFVGWLVKHNGSDDVNFRPQHQQLCISEADVRYDFILPLEHSRSLSEKLWTMMVHNEYVRLPRQMNWTEKKVQNIKLSGVIDDTADLFDHETTKYAKEWLSVLSHEMIEQLYSIYKVDFALMNYSNFSHPDFPFPLHINDGGLEIEFTIESQEMSNLGES